MKNLRAPSLAAWFVSILCVACSTPGASRSVASTVDTRFQNLAEILKLPADLLDPLRAAMLELAAIAKQSAGSRRRGGGQCAEWVKDDLKLAGLMTPEQRTGIALKLDAIALPPLLTETLGFHRLRQGDSGLPIGWKSLFDAPLGTVIVYSSSYSDRPHDGHVEIRIDTGFASDFVETSPITGKDGGLSGDDHRFYGAYVEPVAGQPAEAPADTAPTPVDPQALAPQMTAPQPAEPQPPVPYVSDPSVD